MSGFVVYLALGCVLLWLMTVGEVMRRKWSRGGACQAALIAFVIVALWPVVLGFIVYIMIADTVKASR